MTLHRATASPLMAQHGPGEWTPALSATYWERRARQFARRGRGLAAVCSYGMPAFYNSYIESIQRRALLPCLDAAAAQAGRTALDLGCGVGRWSLELAARGFEVTGVDISTSMVARAERRAYEQRARCTFQVAGICELQLQQQFDLVLCVTVLQHLLDEQLARAAIARIAAHLAPGGRAVLMEAAPRRPAARCETGVFRVRTAHWYRQAFQEAGLAPVAEHGVDPLPLKGWLLPYYRRLPWPIDQLSLAAVTAISWPLDWMLGPYLANQSWHRVWVLEHAVA